MTDEPKPIEPEEQTAGPAEERVSELLFDHESWEMDQRLGD